MVCTLGRMIALGKTWFRSCKTGEGFYFYISNARDRLEWLRETENISCSLVVGPSPILRLALQTFVKSCYEFGWGRTEGEFIGILQCSKQPPSSPWQETGKQVPTIGSDSRHICYNEIRNIPTSWGTASGSDGQRIPHPLRNHSIHWCARRSAILASWIHSSAW